MPRPGESAEEFRRRRFREFKEGRLYSGTGVPGRKRKRPVRNWRQAIAIVMSEMRKGGMRP